MNAIAATIQTHTATAAEAKAKAGLTNKQQGEAKARQEADWQALLHEALTEPGRISEAYSRFHSYSLGNALWVLGQCYAWGIELGPIATFNGWKQKGRMVKKSEHALMMAMPVTIHSRDDDEDDDKATHKATIFMVRRNWFVLSQTEALSGAEPQEIAQDAAPTFDVDAAAKALGLTRQAFDGIDGNCQGYALPTEATFAVSPIAVDPVKTSIHEMAHCLLHGTEGRMIDGAELGRGLKEVEAEGTAYLVCAAIGHTARAAEMRGYVQGWLARSGQEFTQKNARRIFSAAAKILRAGAAAASTASEER